MKTSSYLVLGAFAAVGAITASQTRLAAHSTNQLTATAAVPPPYRLPSDNFPASQATVDAYGWQEFIALNWAASSYPGQPDSTQTMSTFGMPGDFAPGVWNSYKDASDVFGTQVPGPWQDPTQLKLLAKQGGKKFTLMSKVDKQLIRTVPIARRLASGNTNNESALQAAGTWLTDQQGNLIWYEVRINKDEFDYITTNKLYDSLSQVNFARTTGIWLPDGRNKPDGKRQYGTTGAIEVKASWRVIPDGQLTKYQGRYKIVQGQIPKKVVVTKVNGNYYSHLSDFRRAYLGLVGLHIIHKTNNFSQFTWATFEHVDLAPTANQPVDPNKDYLLFNKKCPNQCDVAKPAGCEANQSPTPGQDSVTTPVQVVRCANTVPADAAVDGINQQYQQKIRAANPKSVFQYYKLVSVQWPQSPKKYPVQPSTVPLSTGGIIPSTLGNLASETYALQKGCMSCHQYGNSLAVKGLGASAPSYASDYSFLFSLAKPVLPTRKAAPGRR